MMTAIIGNEGIREDHELRALRKLYELKHTAHALDYTINFTKDMPTPMATYRAQCDALICRPRWGGKVDRELVEHIAKPEYRVGEVEHVPPKEPRPSFVVATLSAGTSHIADDVKGLPGVRVISSEGGNAEQTAELAVSMAIVLRRHVFRRMVMMASGKEPKSKDFPCGSLRQCAWTLIGRGHVARCMLRRLIGLGLCKIVIWNHEMCLTRFEEALELVDPITWLSRRHSHPCAAIGAGGLGPACIVEGTQDKQLAFEGTDIVSIHVDSSPQTDGLVSKQAIGWMRTGAGKWPIVINVGRGPVVNRVEILDALASGDLFGFGSDVEDLSDEDRLAVKAAKAGMSQPPDAEIVRQACRYSMAIAMEADADGLGIPNAASWGRELAWWFVQIEKWKEASPMNILLTPHLGGATHDAEHDIADEVVGKLLYALGLREHVDFYTPPRKRA